MRIMSKEIKEDGSKYIVYVLDQGGSPLSCEYATKDDKQSVINSFIEEFGEISIFEEMTYNEYINQ